VTAVSINAQKAAGNTVRRKGVGLVVLTGPLLFGEASREGRGLANEPTSRGDYRRVSGAEIVCITSCRFVTSCIRMACESTQLAA